MTAILADESVGFGLSTDSQAQNFIVERMSGFAESDFRGERLPKETLPLTFDKKKVDSVVERRGEDATIYGFAAGNAGHADTEDSRTRSGARVGDCAEDPGDVEQRFADWAGFAVSGAPSA
jgi:hypothetical protein